MSYTNIAIVGAGIGGMAAAIALAPADMQIRLFEQAPQLRRVGAAINLTPNAVKVLDWLGPGLALRRKSFSPSYRVSRAWDTGVETSRIEMGSAAERKYGSPQMVVHRADLLSAMLAALPRHSLRLGERLVAITQNEGGVELTFENGARRRFDAVVGADGIHSTVRHSLFGDDKPIYTGMAAYRTIFSAARLQDCRVTTIGYAPARMPIGSTAMTPAARLLKTVSSPPINQAETFAARPSIGTSTSSGAIGAFNSPSATR